MGYEWSKGDLCIYPEKVKEADFVIIQRDFPRYEDDYEQIVASAHDLGKPLIYELDDLLVEMPEWHPDLKYYRKARAAMLRAAFAADAVTCSTPEICDYLGAYNPRAFLLPNYLDDALWSEALGESRDTDRLAAEGPLVIGYVGGSSHLLDLEMIKPALVEVLERFGSDILLRFWGGPPPADLRERGNVEWLDPGLVDYGEFAQYFRRQKCDIVIAPLRDQPFNGAKSGLKFLEYSALALPGVYSDVPPYQRLVNHGDNGFLAATLGAWVDALSQLIETPEMRRKIGEAARRTVREDWLLSHHAHDWVTTYEHVLDEVAERGKAPAAGRTVRRLSHWYRKIEQDLTEQEQINADLKRELVEELMAQQAKHHREMQQLEQDWARQVAEREAVIETITTSSGWRFLKVAGDVRKWFIPPHSLRERILYSAMQRVLALKQEGVKSALTGVAGKQRDEGLPEQHRHPFPVRIVAGKQEEFPAVNLILIAGTSDVDEEMVTAWVDNQTYPNVEIVIWDETQGVARFGSEGDDYVSATGIVALGESLSGRYVCVASADLLRQPRTYLEANVLALETESLAFTINVRGPVEAFVKHLQLQRLPGDGKRPLLHQVVRATTLGDDFAVDLSDWMGGPVVGKVLVHTTHHTDRPVSFDTRLVGQDIEVMGHYAVLDQEELVHEIHPVNTILPSTKDPSELPTVVVAFPFLAVGGAERVALDMMRCLQREIRFVVVTTEGYDLALGTTADAFREITPYVFTSPDFLLSPLNFSFLQHLIERFDVDTFYIANGSEWLYSILSRLKKDYPGLRTANQVYDYRFGWINRYDDDLVANLDAHIGVNRRICEAYVARGVPPEASYLVENGVDTEEFDLARYPEERRRSLRHKLGLSPDRSLVTFISRLHPQKRPMDFVELARRFADDEDLQFLMVGGGPLAGAIDAEVLRIGLKNFERRPFYRPSSDIFAISDVLVLPSEYEGMPLVILEAQAMGKPMVVTDVGNNREVLDVTRGGVVVSRIGDVSALREGVIQMLGDPPEPGQIRQSILEHFSLQRMAEKYRIALLGE
ncbi:MAG: glycosyltransferase [Anaerolineae bacterium]